MLTEDLALIEVPRTGGTMFRNVLSQLSRVYDPPEWGQHTNYTKMAAHAEAIGLPMPPAVAFVRHPETWYLSAWCYTAENVEGFSDTSFEDYLNLVAPGAGRRYLLRRTLTEIWRWIGADKATHICRFENLYGGIRHVIAATMGYRVGVNEMRLVLAKQPVYRGSRVPPTWERLSGYAPKVFWTKALRARVREWDGELMERFGYEF